ncbi:hypothetical protein [Nocardiopsis sp. NPDC006938]|uniref:hypothetical protein n=1 Tax=Nocardiopsis sp. NPDC006938 TaxID=3364337 RepID=UPI00368E3824
MLHRIRTTLAAWIAPTTPAPAPVADDAMPQRSAYATDDAYAAALVAWAQADPNRTPAPVTENRTGDISGNGRVAQARDIAHLSMDAHHHGDTVTNSIGVNYGSAIQGGDIHHGGITLNGSGGTISTGSGDVNQNSSIVNYGGTNTISGNNLGSGNTTNNYY